MLGLHALVFKKNALVGKQLHDFPWCRTTFSLAYGDWKKVSNRTVGMPRLGQCCLCKPFEVHLKGFLLLFSFGNI
jgi:hypothetical protein